MRPLLPSPSNERLRIGARLRAGRQAQGMTMDQLAEATGLTKGFISRVERDVTSPSVTTLVSLCEVLSIPVGSLFESPAHEVVTLTAAPLINMGGSGATERMLTPRSESRLQLIRSRLAAGATGGAELYTVNGDVEAVHVLSGAITVTFENETKALAAGDTVTFSGREPHTWRNASEGPSEVLWVIAPAPWSGSH
ncbi:helix-turn-helix domain-containing protein [Trebonia kvetii]|uniref:Helix-turn-helix domain-containing protein n=1 Tax=Trebonia kvetii TaxID=2480626 RepID=A0A6P2BW87_9ACTN|nr:helix-turn-helix domain-containing protein [Trebonia kvetii]TVZ02967.1 helix-turn-helix domain-containing protein [Trebonia kvetii]